jgi:hypothetical protein
VAAFTVFILQRIVSAWEYGPRGLIFSVFVGVALLNSIRGTFAYRKLPSPPPGTPSLEESFKAFRKIPVPSDPNPPPE